MMPPKKQRRLHLETLEDRRVLSAGPISSNIQVLSVDSSTGEITLQDGESAIVDINRHPAAQDRVTVPFLSGDFNNDDVTDLLARDVSDNTWWLQLNDGTQLFEIPMGPGLPGVEIIGTLDFDGNDSLEVVSIDTSTNEFIVSFNSGGRFQHISLGNFASSGSLTERFIGDFNGDGIDDVLVGEMGEEWHLASRFGIQTWGTFPDYAWTNVLSGHFNNDQYEDIVTLAPDLTWWLFQGTPTGLGGGQYFGHWKMGSDWANINAADFTGDGIDDVIGRTPDGRLRVGTTTPSGFHTWIWGTGWIDSGNWSNVSILDLNDDSLPDQIGQSQDGKVWYGINTGSSFDNYYWQRSGNIDFIVQDFTLPMAVDAIGSMPTGGVDARDLEIFANVDSRNLLEISATGDLQIDGITLSSPSGALIPRLGGGGALPGANEFEVSFGAIQTRLPSDSPLSLGVGWDFSKSADLTATISMGGSEFVVQVPTSLGPAVTVSPLSTPIANELYFASLSPTDFLRNFATDATVAGTANTISSADAQLQVSLTETNSILLTATEPLLLSGVELRSATGSLLTFSGGTSAPADPFLEFLANNSFQIIFSSETWPLLLTGSLELNVGWRPNAPASDLVVEYRLAGDTGISNREAFVAEPLRLPFEDPNATIDFGGQRSSLDGGQRSNLDAAIRSFFGSIRTT